MRAEQEPRALLFSFLLFYHFLLGIWIIRIRMAEWGARERSSSSMRRARARPGAGAPGTPFGLQCRHVASNLCYVGYMTLFGFS